MKEKLCFRCTKFTAGRKVDRCIHGIRNCSVGGMAFGVDRCKVPEEFVDVTIPQIEIIRPPQK